MELTAEVTSECLDSILDDSYIIYNESEEQQSEKFTDQEVCIKFLQFMIKILFLAHICLLLHMLPTINYGYYELGVGIRSWV